MTSLFLEAEQMKAEYVLYAIDSMEYLAQLGFTNPEIVAFLNQPTYDKTNVIANTTHSAFGV
jgi:hypothetical protein